MIKNKLPYLIDVLILLFFSLFPLIWFQHGTILMGHDSGWTIVPLDRLLDRFFTWTKTGFGYDQSIDGGTISIYLLPGILNLLNFHPLITQKITHIFWFFMLNISMYILIRTIYKGNYARQIAILAALFYSINHFTLQAWTIAEISKFSAMTFLPLSLAILWNLIDRNIKVITGIFLFCIISFFFNAGGAAGLPLLGAAIVVYLCFFVYKFFIERKNLLIIVGSYFLFFLVFVFINSYWILPLRSVTSSGTSYFGSLSDSDSAVRWTDVISKNTSIINLLRLQGFSSWYDEPTHPYAYIFLNNPFFILASFIFPLLTFLSVALAKTIRERKIVIFFISVAILSIFFTAGTHPPFGFMYEWMMRHIYAFSIFRTAFYKFGYGIWFAYAFLFSYSVYKLSSYFKNKYLINLGFILALIFVLIYNFPFFTGSFFKFQTPFDTRITLPSYLIEVKDYVKNLSDDSRILLIPPPSPSSGQSDIYNFGYFSRTPLPFEITQKSVVTNVEVNSTGQEELTELLYSSILQNKEELARNIINILGINHVLVRNDVSLNNPKYRVTPPKSFTKNLFSYKWIVLDKKIGPWEIYKIKDPSSQIIAASPNFSLTANQQSNTEFSFSPSVINVSESYKKLIPDNFDLAIYPICDTCKPHGFPHPKKILFLPTSPFYFFEKMQENKNLKLSPPNSELRLGYDLFYSERHALEIQQLSYMSERSDNEILDQQQRATVVNEYKSLIFDVYKTYHNLPEVERINAALGVKDFVEKQRDFLRQLLYKSFFNDINYLYFDTYNFLNKFSEDADIKNLINFRKHTLTYSFTTEKDGEYNFVSTGNANQNINIDGKNYKQNPLHILKGTHRIDLPVSDSTSITESEPFSISGNTGKNIPLSSLVPSQSYTLSFDYMNNQVAALSVQIIDDLGNTNAFQIFTTGSSEFVHADLDFTTGSTIASNYTLRIFADQEGDSKTTLDIKNLSVSKSFIPAIKFTNASKTIFVPSPKPILNIEQKNPTQYVIHVKNSVSPFVLLFKQSFSPDWKASYTNNNKIINHFSAYDAFNGWYLEEKGDYDIKINFNTQKSYVLGAVISIASFILATIIFLTLKIKRFYE